MISLLRDSPMFRRILLMPGRRHWLIAIVAIACATPDGEVMVRDSAGLQVVHNLGTDSGWRNVARWRAEQDLSIGADTGSEVYQFGRIGDLAVSESGEVFAVDQLAGVVRVFGPDGVHRRTVGRPGRGPGELSRSANGVFILHGDSLVVPDPGERRITTFAPDGRPADIVQLPQRPMGQSWHFADNRFFMRGLTISRDSSGSFQFWDALLSLSRDASRADTLLLFDHAKTDLGGPGRLRVQLIVNNPSWTRLTDGRIAWTALDRDYVMVHDSLGVPVRRITHAQWVARSITPADRAGMVELLREKLRAIGGDASFADSPAVEAPLFFPAITTVRTGPDNTLWVQRMGALADIDPMAINAPDRADFFGGPVWDVLDHEGRFLGTLTLPARFRIFRITADYIYGAARDESGIERILRLRLYRD